jgi:hypothetical protein
MQGKNKLRSQALLLVKTCNQASPVWLVSDYFSLPQAAV